MLKKNCKYTVDLSVKIPNKNEYKKVIFGKNSLIGKNVKIGGQAGISGHLKIGDNVEIAGGSGVIKDIPDNSKVMGYPAKNIRQFLKDNK